MRSSSISPIGMVSIRVRSQPRAWAHWIRSGISAALSRARATALIFTSMPAARAASIPAWTWARSPPRVSRRNSSGRRVSIETLTRRTPSRARSAARTRPGGCRWWSGSARPARRVAGGATGARSARCTPLRTRGSPPVSRSLRTPRPTNTEATPLQLLERQHLGLGQEAHVLGHAVDAAQVAAVGDRQAQIGHLAAEPVGQAARRGAAQRVRWRRRAASPLVT